jgi:hypothetical protein
MSKIFQKLNINIDVDKAKSYYNTLVNDYSHKRWDCPLGNETISGWSIQGIKGRTGNFGFYGSENEPRGVENYFETELAFGWGKEMLDLFPYGYRAGVGVSPSNTVVPPHVDESAEFGYKLHIPIITNDKYVWTTEEGLFHMPEGSVYLVNTSYTHSTVNNGTDARVHFGMVIPITDIKFLEQYF